MCTLSCASARVCWIEPDLTTVSRRCVCPPGPVVVGAGRVAVAAAAAPVPAAATSPPHRPRPRAGAWPARGGGRGSWCRSRWWRLRQERRGSGRRRRRFLARRDGSRLGRCFASRSFRLAALFSGHGQAERLAAFLAPLEEVFGDVDHGALPSLQRSGDAAVFTDAPEVHGHEDDDHEWQQQHMEHVPPQQGLVADLLRPEQDVLDRVPRTQGCTPSCSCRPSPPTAPADPTGSR